MKYLNIFLIVFLSITLFSCSSDDSSTMNETGQEEGGEDEITNQKLTAVSFPSGQNLAYSNDQINFEYDESEKISKIYTIGEGTIYGVTHVDDNLIEMELLQENISNAELQEKKSIHIKNNSIEFIVTDRSFKFIGDNRTEYFRDSISFIYANNYISKIESYTKKSTSKPILTEYIKNNDLVFEITNGNITKVVKTEGELIKTSVYTYDENPYIELGEYAYETPFNFGFDYILIHDKIGKGNSNNIVSITNTFETPYDLIPEYESINYKRVMDEEERIQEILLSGKTIATHPSYPSSTTFADEKVIFTYK